VCPKPRATKRFPFLEEIDEFHWQCSRALRQVTAPVKIKQ
jgi:hypothetical protein